MMGDKLILDFNSDEKTIWLVLASNSGLEQKNLIWLRDGFGLADATEAIMATGWVRQVGQELRLTSDIRFETLHAVVEAMLDYFDRPGTPSRELLEIQAAVSDYDAIQSLADQIPLFAFAWLDVIVREDLADEARSAGRIWHDSKIVIDLARYCDGRVAELVSRYSPAPTSSRIGAMARSIPTRKADESRSRIG